MRVLLCFCLALLPAAAWADAPLRVDKPWLRYLLPNLPAAGYMVLQNNRDASAMLTGASSPACGMLMLHQSQDESGTAMMTDVPAITIPAHGSLSLAPGTYHLMCMSPVMKLGEIVPITLTFRDGSKITISAPVYGAQGAP